MAFFTHKKIDLTFTKGRGTFAEGGKNTVKLSGLRVSANIVRSGGSSQGSADLRIYGMTLSKMNDLSTLGLRVSNDTYSLLNNSVLVEAGDENGINEKGRQSCRPSSSRSELG